MNSVGERLRHERLKSGLELEALSKLTRIRQSYLEAIETGSTDDAPNGFFYRSFVRQYATALGVPAGEIEAELERGVRPDKFTLSGGLGRSKSRTDMTSADREPPQFSGLKRAWLFGVLLLVVLAVLYVVLRST